MGTLGTVLSKMYLAVSFIFQVTYGNEVIEQLSNVVEIRE